MPKLALAIALLILVFTAACKAVNPSPKFTLKTKNEGIDRAVHIDHACEGRTRWSWGSGVVLEPNVILTAYHVVECKGRQVIYVKHGGKVVRGHLGMASPAADLALLVVEEPLEAPPVRFGPPPDKGTSVCAYPGREEILPLCGVATRRNQKAKEDLRMRMDVQPGDSGSGVYDRFGRLVGVVISRLDPKYTKGETVGFATLLTGKLSREEPVHARREAQPRPDTRTHAPR